MASATDLLAWFPAPGARPTDLVAPLRSPGAPCEDLPSLFPTTGHHASHSLSQPPGSGSSSRESGRRPARSRSRRRRSLQRSTKNPCNRQDSSGTLSSACYLCKISMNIAEGHRVGFNCHTSCRFGQAGPNRAYQFSLIDLCCAAGLQRDDLSELDRATAWFKYGMDLQSAYKKPPARPRWP